MIREARFFRGRQPVGSPLKRKDDNHNNFAACFDYCTLTLRRRILSIPVYHDAFCR